MLALSKHRKELEWFANEMERVLLDNDHKAGWHDSAQSYLLARLMEEAGELRDALLDYDKQWIIKEATDVANFAMMIADKARLL